ncbi:Dynactin subunit 3 [Heterocephalus glaber]|uniref:Dynactin subunit 3 n=1 Tax=Heterocephalus glaber TaxID=10181 RepID=G5BUY4_HETGA|nr:Dynactin subunit 3 [Heterocephalus glaber]
MAALTDVQRLQARVEELERWVYGPVGARGSQKVADGLVKDQCMEITEESKALLEEYNKTTMLLSKQFMQWDELLCQPEAAKQVKPAEH